MSNLSNPIFIYAFYSMVNFVFSDIDIFLLDLFLNFQKFIVQRPK